ncbi:MAG: pyridoxamine 5'-phosphate oxidase family protein [Caulobacteraceae bacterium]
MSATHAILDDRLIAFIKAQHVFFVATAPLTADGCVNVSPKGYDSFAILDPTTVAYLDYGGSGVETLAHVRENGRITLMFCAFDGAANILRLYGQGQAMTLDEPDYPRLRALFPGETKARAVIVVQLTRIADSCGWGVPFMEFKAEREQLRRWIDNRSEEEWREKRYAANARSVDGLPGLTRAE